MSLLSIKPILVIGDAILDEYIDMDVNRISPEAPVPVGLVKSKSYKVGGAANVACALASLNSRVDLACLVGTDEAGDKIIDICGTRNINFLIEPTISMSTTKKTRFVSNNNHLLRVDEEEIADKSESLKNAVSGVLFSDYDFAIVSDYGKGLIGPSTCQYLNMRNRNIQILVDPKSPCIDSYKNTYLLKPNKNEFEKLFNLSIESLKNELSRVLDVLKLNNIQNMLITCGDKGAYLIESGNSQFTHIAAPSKDVFDVTGAGDVAIATLCKSLALGYNLLYSCQISIKLATFSVQHFGTWHPSIDEFIDATKF
tara:strand:- start:1164 stop:2099 length:936 start_codon:yes stop_codon:yes gene_type:complete